MVKMNTKALKILIGTKKISHTHLLSGPKSHETVKIALSIFDFITVKNCIVEKQGKGEGRGAVQSRKSANDRMGTNKVGQYLTTTII